MTEKPANHKGRPRSATAEAAILTATLELIEQKPLGEVTAEAIAQRAGVSKATIYKWWPNKNRVALDAFLSRSRTEIPSSDTGSAVRDFTEQLVAAARFYRSSSGRMARQFIAEGQSDPELLALYREEFLRPRRQAVRELWERGVARGEIRPELDAELVIDLIFGPMFYRLLVGHGSLADSDAEAIVTAVFRGLHAAPGSETKREQNDHH
ncbi:MAG TPA: TetR/AcrR family transcriptional regulator [Pirellulales bacterium]|jgi:AcrR family transcriptional regulator|nr:TetR/AcrR family transcriptional regulator [Pirellulales bacterium]